ncbi:oxidoreductase [Stenotrophobium rhamnosiphilum]|uniref:Short-chain dehydrogenase n=1 Tax=Stenotrophobium rhamnosiphilum TaxID=2029166 RepID=A0A2T5MG45_9GAMM|nr:oxidoreductase [Stenotrophobium rhamnosiphilum]PTU31557.1 short-chain dehydrogenase [Stenotrophobium rhamnosiphilum]
MTTLDWCRKNLPKLDGKRALVTGAASGLGYETAAGLAAMGAHVILADRNVEGGQAAVKKIRESMFGVHVEFRALDLADLAEIRGFADTLRADGEPLDILVNNAGILPPLERRVTADGFELKFGVNVLGHFALDGQLLESLRRSSAPRVVWVSSLVHRHASIDFRDLQAERSYEPQRAYNQAKLACLVLAMELHERAKQSGIALSALAAHPGVARTGLGDARATEKHRRIRDYAEAAAFWVAMKWMSQPQGRGALPILHAAAADAVRSGTFFGPDGVGEMKGDPKIVKPSKSALDPVLRQRLWAECEKLTGVRYEL